MKNLYFTFLLSTLSLCLYAQGEYPFLTDGKQWVQDEYYADGSNPSTLTYFEFTLGETVMVDGEQYRQVLRDTVFEEGLLREVDGRLLILRNEETNTLLDFNLEVGDTIVVAGEGEISRTQHMILLSIDSTTILDGSIRKRLNFELNNVSFDGGGFGVSWIDGIGSTRGTIVNKLCSTNTLLRSSGSCQSELICVKDSNERMLYNSTEDEIYDCNKIDIISSNDTYELPKGSFTVYPNPASNFVLLEGSNQYKISRVVLADMSGRRVLDRTLASPTTETCHIAVDGFARGIYNLTVFTPRGEWTSLRVIKQ